MPAPIDPQDQYYEAVIIRTLNAFAVDVMSIPNVADLFWYVAQNVVGRLGFIDCVIYEANKEQTELIQVAALGEKNPFGRSIVNPLKIPFGEGITGRAAQEKEAIVVNDILRDTNYIADTEPARSEICVPMIFRNRVVGVIDSEHPSPNAFGDAELEILTTVAAMTSAKLELLAEADRSNQRYHDLMDSHAQLTQEVRNRKSLESKLFEARKLEAVGRLSGGFAHDFNNLLTVISGNLDLLSLELSDAPKAAQDNINDAQVAATHGATLIRNMLTFSQRSRLVPKNIDLNELVANTSEQNGQLWNTTIDLKLILSTDLWPICVDQNTTESTLLNLIFNARDAMQTGGTLEITTENVTLSWAEIQSQVIQLLPGNYVRLNVKDTGTGIPKDRIQQIFDPFYTTKEAGSGTGLGLSMILGFMKQSGGTVLVNSEVGQGSIFQLYFPANFKPVSGIS